MSAARERLVKALANLLGEVGGLCLVTAAIQYALAPWVSVGWWRIFWGAWAVQALLAIGVSDLKRE